MIGICTECGQSAIVRKVDNGIGWTEAWGVRSKHEDWDAETQCCDAPALHEDGSPITVWDIDEEYEG